MRSKVYHYYRIIHFINAYARGFVRVIENVAPTRQRNSYDADRSYYRHSTTILLPKPPPPHESSPGPEFS